MVRCSVTWLLWVVVSLQSGMASALSTPPTDLTATAGADGIVLSWTAPVVTTDTVGGYNVNRCAGAGCTPEYYHWVPSGATYKDQDVTASTLYRYSISAYYSNSATTSDWSNIVEETATVTVTPPAVPVPTGLTATAGANGIVLSWTAPETTTDTVGGYNVNRCEGAGCTPEYHDWVPSGTTYTDQSVTANTLYRYSVSAYFEVSDTTSDWSNVVEETASVTVTVTPATVPAPTGLTAAAGSNGVVLNWTAPEATTDTLGGYNVNRCEGADCTPEYYDWVPSGTTYRDRAVTANTLYRFSVSAYFSTSDTTSDWSNVVDVTVEETEPGYRDLVQTMYVAYYGRPGDAGGLDFWAAELEKVNGNLSRIIDNFGNSKEFQDRFGDLDNEELVNNIFLQLLGRDADSEGLNFYVNGLREGRFTLASIALNVADGTKDLDAMIKANKLRVANAFTEAYVEAGAAYGEFQIDDAKLWLAGVDSTDASVTAALDSLPDLLEMFPEGMPPASAEPVLKGSFIEKYQYLENLDQDFIRDPGGITWSGVAWRGDRVHAPLAVWTNDGTQRDTLEYEMSDFTNGEGGLIAKDQLRILFPRYVKADPFQSDCGYASDKQHVYLTDALAAAPGPIELPDDPFKIWLAMDVPADTPAGGYSGTFLVRSPDKKKSAAKFYPESAGA